MVATHRKQPVVLLESVLPRGGRGMSACVQTIFSPLFLQDPMSKLWRRGSTSGAMEAPEPGKRRSIKQLGHSQKRSALLAPRSLQGTWPQVEGERRSCCGNSEYGGRGVGPLKGIGFFRALPALLLPYTVDRLSSHRRSAGVESGGCPWPRSAQEEAQEA